MGTSTASCSGDGSSSTSPSVCPRSPAQPLGTRWLEVLQRLWGDTWVAHVRLRDQVLDSGVRMIALDEQQLQLLDIAGENPLAVVEGGAGVGKTIVARELCLRRARQGQRTLYLCFTDALAHGVDAQMRAAGLSPEQARAVTVRRYACELLQRAGEPVEPEREGFWAGVSAAATRAAVPPPEDRPDLVVVDEAQDLEDSDWGLVAALSEGRSRWLFHDPRQSFWHTRHIPESLLHGTTRLQLRRQQRCPEALARFADLYGSREERAAGGTVPLEAVADLGFLREAVSGSAPPLRVLVGPAAAFEERLLAVLDALIREGA
ncbi:MAG: ATP-binding protein, partial [Myxococcaceae bacterium]|nr:ATP-binding protein [Myxococcaceae bacterium]